MEFVFFKNIGKLSFWLDKLERWNGQQVIYYFTNQEDQNCRKYGLGEK